MTIEIRADDNKAQANECPHPPERLYTWTAFDGSLCVACCDCGEVLKGGA